MLKKWRAVSKKHPNAVALLKVIGLFIVITALCWKRLDPDFGWHLSAGDYIRQHWIPAHDLYSYTATNYRWINHEWGNDVITSWLYQVGGYTTLAIVFGAVWTAGLTLFRKKIRFSVLLVAAVALFPYLGVRPAAWTVLGLAILIELITRGTKRAKQSIPILFLIWVNLHGGFIIGLAVLAYFWIKQRNWDWFYLLLVAIGVSFINPYGPRLWVEIAHTLFNPALHFQIVEWQYFYLLPASWAFIVLWGVGFCIVDMSRLKNWFNLAPLLLLASLSASRNVPLFVVAALRDSDRYLPQIKLPKNLKGPGKAMVMTFRVTIIVWIGFILIENFQFPWYGREESYPTNAVLYLSAHPCQGNLFNAYTVGGYLIWRLPSTRVYIDGRMPTWHDPSGRLYTDRYFDILKDPSAQKTEFSRYNVKCALVDYRKDGTKLINRLDKAGWKTVSRDQGMILLVKH